ncbi:hypothetical protein [Gordonia sp. FQ]|uniref:hypothetical protein n=1 Tax=Gordonia sp. FQ TaxID=3446634 RepID=UPI003F829AEF
MSGDAPASTPEKEPDHFPGERGRTVPRAAWWVLGVALVVLIAFVLARPDWFSHRDDGRGLGVPDDRHFTHSLADLGRSDGVWLTDDSPSATFTTVLPADSGPGRTRLRLRGTTQVPEAATVFLTVVTDGQQIAKISLPHGEQKLDAIVTVPEGQVAGGRLRTQIRIEGALGDTVCLADQTVGMQVHLAPDSMVEAALDTPVHTVRDAVAGWGHELTIALRDDDPQWRTAAAQLGLALTRAGHRVRFADRISPEDRRDTVLVGPENTLTGDDHWHRRDDPGTGLVLGAVSGTPVLALTDPRGAITGDYLTTAVLATGDAGAADPLAVTVPGPAGDEVPLAALGADTGSVRITESRRWRADYALAGLAGGRAPRAVRAQFTLPASPSDLTWILNVELNGTLVESRPLGRDGAVTVPLPAARQAATGSVSLTVQRDRDLGGCDVRVTGYPIQLDDSSALLLGPPPAGGLASIPAALSPGYTVYVPDAAAPAVATLDALVPVLAALDPAGSAPDIVWGGAPPAGHPFVVVGTAPGVTTPVTLDGDRLRAGSGLNVPAFRTGLLLQTAAGPGAAPGLSIVARGETDGLVLPQLGADAAVAVTPSGAFAVARDGSTVPVPAAP